MAQYRQSGTERHAARTNNSDLHHNSTISPDHIALGIRPNGSAPPHGKHGRWRRSARSEKGSRLTFGSIIVVLSLVLVVTVLAYYYISGFNKETIGYNSLEDGDLTIDGDFLTNISMLRPPKVVYGHGSVAHGLDSRYWDRDDRRRDNDYNEDAVEHKNVVTHDDSLDIDSSQSKSDDKKTIFDSSRKGVGLYNEAGRNELKKYEVEYEASLEKRGRSRGTYGTNGKLLEEKGKGIHHEAVDPDTDYDDALDSDDARKEEYHDYGHNQGEGKRVHKDKEAEEVPSKSSRVTSSRSSRKSPSDLKKRPKHHRFSGIICEMKLLNSTGQLVEPLESHKFARFSLQYKEREEKPAEEQQWVPRFAGHQTLQDREESFHARDQKVHCGFVKGPEGSSSTGFDLMEDDTNYISRCHIAVISCIFGNSDRLRAPTGKTVSRLSRKNVCFVMFVDEVSLQTISAEGQSPDREGFIGLWKIVVVKNLPYTDMRRVGKIPKLLPHRLFPSARYSIWLDSKLRLQLDPLLILEYFLWRKGHEFAISNHYTRHCVWEEVAQNKKLNKYNHTVIDQQFAFYQTDGLTRFDASDPNKLLPSNVPEGSFIVRAHTPMSNLFSCLWFNEVERFTPRDQLSFAYTYQKLRSTNPEKPYYLNMFKDCERRKITKLYHHRAEEKRNTQLKATE